MARRTERLGEHRFRLLPRLPLHTFEPAADALAGSGFTHRFRQAQSVSRLAEVVDELRQVAYHKLWKGFHILAGLVTLTTRTSDMVDALVTATRPLRGVGIDPERLGLLLALGIRAVPIVVGLAEEIRDAQWARGLTLSPRAFAVPLIVRALRHTDTLADAMIARGIDD